MKTLAGGQTYSVYSVGAGTNVAGVRSWYRSCRRNERVGINASGVITYVERNLMVGYSVGGMNYRWFRDGGRPRSH